MKYIYKIIQKCRSIFKFFIYNKIRIFYRKILYKLQKREQKTGETFKAKNRRTRERFFKIYCKGIGLDIGYGGDLIHSNANGWDLENGDAQLLRSIQDNTYNFVYSSHTLEHLERPDIAITNWWRVLKKNGYLILYIPHRDLFEKRKRLPSRFNTDHKYFFLLKKDEFPDTIGIIPFIKRNLTNYKIIYARICSNDYKYISLLKKSEGEYSIEIVLKKL